MEDAMLEVTINIDTGDDIIELTIKEAKEVYERLGEIFGEEKADVIQSPYPMQGPYWTGDPHAL